MSNTTQALSRIEAILDDSSFVEIGARVTARATDFNMQEKKAPSDGVITGYGVVNGNLVYVYSQDASVLGGTIGEMHAKKIASLYEKAMKMGAPVDNILMGNPLTSSKDLSISLLKLLECRMQWYIDFITRT